MSFATQLKIGLDYEKKVLKSLQKKYPLATRIVGQFVDYDIWIPEIGKSVEVKYDKKSEETNNIIIEFEKYNDVGDILLTKADYWCIHSPIGLLWITPLKIIECLLREDCKKITLQNSRCFLIAVDTLVKYSVKGELE